MRPLAVVALFTFCAGLASCSATRSERDPNVLPEECATIAVDRFKSLVIVDEAVMSDRRARNDANGPWSFRRRLDEMTPSGVDVGIAARAWLETWRVGTKINLFDVPPRARVDQKAICNWLRAVPKNGCDGSCGTCVERKFDTAYAPFRLIAITNRADLAVNQDVPEAVGEARFSYALTDGPGDDPASRSLDMTVIFEYRQPLRGRTRSEIATAWNGLGKHVAFDDAYKAELETLMASFHEPGAEPNRPLGSAISTVRTNEREFEWTWGMREYHLTEAGLTLASLHNTPDSSLNGSTKLAALLTNNRQAILELKHVIPEAVSGGEVGILQPWSAPNIDTRLVDAFTHETCNGCHQNAEVDFNFHVSPHKRGIEKLSHFMHNPADPAGDDVARREGVMRQQLCTVAR